MAKQRDQASAESQTTRFVAMKDLAKRFGITSDRPRLLKLARQGKFPKPVGEFLHAYREADILAWLAARGQSVPEPR